ncbi:DUF6644 family protein [Novosphingobium sp. FKTRR1]|uniref:DUF6644 family protein n=1 Tax=unclassified Novosphingobium TaxID=2644732 RepID=UPI001CEFC816|nr:DUF6644 family protein [Novosphingobium sp. FKTRR1]
MSLQDFANTLADTWLATELTDSTWLFGTVESFHVVALTLVFGSIALVDLRLLGLVQGSRPVNDLLRSVLPLTWAGFALAAITGTTLIFANPIGYSENFFFKGKLLLLLLAGLNVAVFHFWVQPRATSPEALAPRISGGISLVLWVTIVSFGRWIGFTI